MRIALIAHSFPPVVGGGESHVLVCAEFLSKFGHEVAVFTSKTPSQLAEKERFDNQFSVYRIPLFKEFELGKIGFKEFLPDLYFYLKKFKPDIIHIHNFIPFLAFSFISSAFSKAKIYFSYHSTPVPEENKILGYFNDFNLEKFFANFIFTSLKYNFLVCPSKYYQEWAIRLGCEKNKTIVVYPGIDMDLFRPQNNVKLREKLKYDKKDFVFCSPVRLIRRKGVIDLIKAISLIKDKNIKLLISTASSSANQELKVKVSDLIKKSELSDRVKICYDMFSYKEMAPLYASVDAVILPSHVEGLGISLLEAMACKKPVLGSNTYGISEIISNYSNGLLFKPKDPAKIAKSMKEIFLDCKLRERIVENAFKTVSRKFNACKQTKKLEKIYESL